MQVLSLVGATQFFARVVTQRDQSGDDPGAGTTTKTIINGHTATFTATLAGTALGYTLPGCCGQLEELTNANVTITK